MSVERMSVADKIMNDGGNVMFRPEPQDVGDPVAIYPVVAQVVPVVDVQADVQVHLLGDHFFSR